MYIVSNFYILYMKFNIRFVLLGLLAMFSCSSSNDSDPVDSADPVKPTKTVVYLIRHAEKADSSADTNLSAAGLQRANNWATILQGVAFDAFYSTNYNRTRQTIQPTATSNGKDVVLYNPSNFSLANIVSNHQGKNIFIVGHSNTIPALINAYIGQNIYQDMDETEFGNLYKVTVDNGVISHEMTVHD